MSFGRLGGAVEQTLVTREPEDQPEFETVLAHRDRLIVGVTASGADAEARRRTVLDLAEAVFERAAGLCSTE